MVSNLFLGIVFAQTLCLQASAADITGIWIQDIDTQRKFNSSRAIMTAEDKDSIGCGEQKMEFGGNVVLMSQKKLRCKIDKKMVVVHPYEFKFYYRILFEGDDAVVIEASKSDGTDRHVEIYHFVSERLMWAYYFGESARDEDHLRVYYKRVDD